jgi:hypothetical protein
MDHTTFSKLVDDRCGKIKAVLSSKADEYSSEKDRLHNFKAAAMAKGETPFEALWGMYMKHWVAVQDMIQSEEVPSQEWLDEKIGDSINYHILLEGLFTERLDAKPHKEFEPVVSATGFPEYSNGADDISKKLNVD